MAAGLEKEYGLIKSSAARQTFKVKLITQLTNYLNHLHSLSIYGMPSIQKA